MKLIIGLGNPGKKYCFTRHNVGYLVVDELIRANNPKVKFKKKLNFKICSLEINGEKVLLARAATYMNESGVAVIGRSAPRP